MSLINEALKRARQESRRREALAKGLPLALPSRSVSHRSWMVAAVVAMALALLISLVTIARLATKDPKTPASVAVSSEGIDIQGIAAEPEPTPLVDTSIEPVVATRPVGESPRDTKRLQTSDSSAPPGSPAEKVERTVTATPAPTELANPPAEGVGLFARPRDPDSEDSPGRSSSQPRVFVERATLASGDTLELGGIAWSETGPYALLDERVVGLGESVMGYMVTRIAPQEVELEGSEGAILIRLK